MHTHTLDWFEEIAADASGYRNPAFELYVAPPEPEEAAETAEPELAQGAESGPLLPREEALMPEGAEGSVEMPGAFPASDGAEPDAEEAGTGDWTRPDSPEKVRVAGTLVDRTMAEMAGFGGLVAESTAVAVPEDELEVQAEDKDGKGDGEVGGRERRDSQAA